MTDNSPFNEQISSLRDKLDREHTENVQRLTGLEAGQEQIRDKIADQKELITKDNKDIKEELSKMDTRISNLEKWVWRATGALAIGFGIVNVVMVIIQFMKK